MTDLIKDADYWKNYRKSLLQTVKQKEKEPKLEKNPENIFKKAKECGIKPTARYFGIQPSQVRYYVKKQENKK